MKRSPRLSALLAAGALVASGLMFAPTAAFAAEWQVDDWESLQLAVSEVNATTDTTVDDNIITINSSFAVNDQMLEITGPVTLELAGNTIEGVRVRTTEDLIMRGGTWHAGAESDAEAPAKPGLGVKGPATLLLDKMNVRAFGTYCDAAIGGWNTTEGALSCGSGEGVSAGVVAMTDSTVFASAPRGLGAAIGAGGYAPVEAIIILNSDVTAHAPQARAAAIGGTGFDSGGGMISIVESTVTANTIGAGDDFRLDDTEVHVIDSTLNGVTLQAERTKGFLSGENRFTGTSVWAGEVTNYGLVEIEDTLQITGTVNNVVTMRPASRVTGPEGEAPDIKTNNYTFELMMNFPGGGSLDPITVYASTFELAQDWPPSGLRPGYTFEGWNTAADGSGIDVTRTTDLASLETTTLYGQWAAGAPGLAEISVSSSATSVDQGDTVTLTVAGEDQFGDAMDVDPADVVVTSSVESDVVDGLSVTFSDAGARELTATVGEFSDSVSVDVAQVLAGVEVSASATSVDQGDSVTLTVAGVDAAGDAMVVDPADVVVTSSVASDIIDGLTVTFPTASPHVLTVTVGDLSAEVTIEVVPAAPVDPPVEPGDPGDTDGSDDGDVTAPGAVDDDEDLATTGGIDGTPILLGALAVVLVGVVLMLLGRRRAAARADDDGEDPAPRE